MPPDDSLRDETTFPMMVKDLKTSLFFSDNYIKETRSLSDVKVSR